MGRNSKTQQPAPAAELIPALATNPVPAPEPMIPEPPHCFAGDFGNAYSNVLADGGVSVDFRSIQGRVSEAKAMDALPFDACISLDGVMWAFGEQAYTLAGRNTQDFPSSNRYTTDFYRRMVAYGLHRAYGLRLNEDEIFQPRVVLSIPARLYSNDSYVAAVKKNVTGMYNIKTTLHTLLRVEIFDADLIIIPEGAGSFLAASASNGLMEQGLWLTGDAGFKTFDLVGFKDGDYVPDLADSETMSGMSVVASGVARFIEGQTRVSLSPAFVDPLMKCGSITVNGTPINVQDVVNAGLKVISSRIANFMLKVASEQNVAGILLTGGGIELLNNHLPAALKECGLPYPITANSPRTANVQGAYNLIAGA